jgi:hypothetical protein
MRLQESLPGTAQAGEGEEPVDAALPSGASAIVTGLAGAEADDDDVESSTIFVKNLAFKTGALCDSRSCLRCCSSADASGAPWHR